MLDHLTLPEIINELRSLTKSSASGVFFIVTDEKHSASFGFDEGRIVAIQYRVRSGEAAIALIAKIKRGSCRFEAFSQPSVRNISALPGNEEIFLKIMTASQQLEGDSQPHTAVRSSQMEKPHRDKVVSTLSLQQKSEIEHILIDELGPIGSIVMESVGRCSALNDMLAVVEGYIDRPEIIKSVAIKLRSIL